MRRISDENPQGERYCRSRVGIVLHEVLQEVVALNGNVFDSLRAFGGQIHGLLVCVLGSSRGFVQETLLIAADGANAASEAIIVHCTFSMDRFDLVNRWRKAKFRLALQIFTPQMQFWRIAASRTILGDGYIQADSCATGTSKICQRRRERLSQRNSA
jgi:hypothetical protein